MRIGRIVSRGTLVCAIVMGISCGASDAAYRISYHNTYGFARTFRKTRRFYNPAKFRTRRFKPAFTSRSFSFNSNKKWYNGKRFFSVNRFKPTTKRPRYKFTRPIYHLKKRVFDTNRKFRPHRWRWKFNRRWSK